MTESRSRIDGEFNGYDDGAIFKLANGQVWQQKKYQYRYKYAYRPEVRIYRDGTKYMMEVAVMSEPIEVVHVDIMVEGPIVSDFTGFDGDMKFEFKNGQIWQQAEYKYAYRYAYRPDAVIVNGVNGYTLHVDGMSDTVRVKRIR
jgi:hypothetical protein